MKIPKVTNNNKKRKQKRKWMKYGDESMTWRRETNSIGNKKNLNKANTMEESPIDSNRQKK